MFKYRFKQLFLCSDSEFVLENSLYGGILWLWKTNNIFKRNKVKHNLKNLMFFSSHYQNKYQMFFLFFFQLCFTKGTIVPLQKWLGHIKRLWPILVWVFAWDWGQSSVLCAQKAIVTFTLQSCGTFLLPLLFHRFYIWFYKLKKNKECCDCSTQDFTAYNLSWRLEQKSWEYNFTKCQVSV